MNTSYVSVKGKKGAVIILNFSKIFYCGLMRNNFQIFLSNSNLLSRLKMETLVNSRDDSIYIYKNEETSSTKECLTC